MDPLTTWLLNQGPTGVLAIALVALYKAKERAATRHAAELKELHTHHREELDILVERHRITTGKLLDKGQELAMRLAGQRARRKTGVVAVAEADES